MPNFSSPPPPPRSLKYILPPGGLILENIHPCLIINKTYLCDINIISESSLSMLEEYSLISRS